MNKNEKKSIGKDRTSTFVLLIIVLLSSNVVVYLGLQNQVSSVTIERNRIQYQLDSLNTTFLEYRATHGYDDTEYALLESDFDSLEGDYLHLVSEYDKILSKHEIAMQNYARLTSQLKEFHEELISHIYIPESFSRVLDRDAVMAVSSTVWSISGGSLDKWDVYEEIYDYIISNIEYVSDVDVLYIIDCDYTNIDGVECVTGFWTDSTKQYVQTPELTLDIEQGDCDDQTVLAYAMIQYYREYILDERHSLYLAEISFSEGTGHLAVIMPVQGGRICVIDPAGRYLTSSWGSITSKPAQSELQSYSIYWASSGSIEHIKLYSVSIENGNYNTVFEGTLSKAASFLAQD